MPLLDLLQHFLDCTERLLAWLLARASASIDVTDFFTVDHLLHGSASNVVRTGRSVNGIMPKLTPYRLETPSPIKTKLNAIHYFRGNSSMAKTHRQPIKGASPTKGQRISFC
jgi:hypothetical protein